MLRQRHSAVPDARTLTQCLLFVGLGEEELAQVATVTTLLRAQAGDQLVLEDTPADALYAVLKGAVQVHRSSPGGKLQVLRFVGPGEVFGEAAALVHGAYPASAQALEPSELLRIDAAGFRRLLTDSPTLSVNVILTLWHRLQELVRVVEGLSLQDVTARVAKYLLDLQARALAEGKPPGPVHLGVKKGELASRLGTTPETLSRTLAKLRDREVIAVKGRIIRILDRGALEAAAAGLEA